MVSPVTWSSSHLDLAPSGALNLEITRLTSAAVTCPSRLASAEQADAKPKIIRPTCPTSASFTTASQFVSPGSGAVGVDVVDGGGVLVGEGVLVREGALVGEGVLVRDGVLVGCGVLVPDGVMVGVDVLGATIMTSAPAASASWSLPSGGA